MLKFSRKFGLQGLNCDEISHKKSRSRNIKQDDNKETNMESFKKYVTCIMAFFTPFNAVTRCQFYSITTPVLFTKLFEETTE